MIKFRTVSTAGPEGPAVIDPTGRRSRVVHGSPDVPTGERR